MLVVVHDGYVALLAQSALYFKTFRRFDVFEVYASESRSHGFYRSDECFGVVGVKFNVECVESCVYFKEKGFSFHHGLCRQRADIAQAEHGRAVGDYGYEIGTSRVVPHCGRVLLNLFAGVCDAGRVGERQVGGVGIGLGRYDGYFAGLRVLVVGECFFFQVFHFF